MRQVDQTRKSGIYQIVNNVNGNRYVGSAVYIKSRWAKHRMNLNNNNHHAKYLQRSWNKYGSDKFNFLIIEECDKAELIIREQFYIDLYNPEYNHLKLAFSSLGFTQTEETKNKLREIFKGREPVNKGVKRKPETIELLREAWKKRKLTPVSTETKAKMSKSKRGRKLSKEHIEKVRIANTGKKRLNPRKGFKHKPETIELYKQMRKGTQSGVDNPMYGKRGPDSPNYGKPRSEQTRLLIGQKAKERWALKKKIPC